MKTKLFGLFILISASFSAQKVDPKMVGCWKGTETDQQVEGMTKYWISCRQEDGKSILLFIALKDGEVIEQSTENGKWWTKDGKYYELHDYDGITDVYNYKLIGDNKVEYRSIELFGKPDNSYVFNDERIIEKTKK